LKQLQKMQLLFVSCSVGLSMLATYLLGFLLGLILMVALFVGINLYIRKRQAKALEFFGVREADIENGRVYGNVSSSTKLRYVCLSCGAKVTTRTCRKCGSHMKKVVF
jgi:hypothetical protein